MDGFGPLIEVINAFVDKMDAEQVADRVGLAAMTEMQGEYIERIFTQGLKSDGTPIGTYSTKPAYYTKEQFVRKGAFKAQGKTSSKDFANGNKRKSMYIGTGYAGLRKVQGRQNEKKDYNYSGSLKQGFSVLKDGAEVLFGQSSQFEIKKMKGLEKRDGSVFQLAQGERDLLRDAISEGMAILYKSDD